MAYYKTIAIDDVDLERIRCALDEEARRQHIAGEHLSAAGCGETRRRIVGQIREQQTPKERAADLRRQYGSQSDEDDARLAD